MRILKSTLLAATLLLGTSLGVYAQQALKVTYSSPSRGARGGAMGGAIKTVATIVGDQVRIATEMDTAALIKANPEMAERLASRGTRGGVRQSTYIDYGARKYYNVATLPAGDNIATEMAFTLPGETSVNTTGNPTDGILTITDSDTVICGYKCKEATTTVRSNTMKYWFTAPIDGARGSMSAAAQLPDGVVLMASRNGNISLRAESVEKIPARKAPKSVMPATMGEIVKEPMFRYRINNADVITVPIFNSEYIGMAESNAPATTAELEADKVYRLGGGTVILKKVKLPPTKGRDIFAQVVQRADKDAYDRTGSVFVIPMGKEKSFLDALITGLDKMPAFVDNKGTQFPGLISGADYQTPVELMRFFTPFGVGGYNSSQVPGQVWADSVIYHQEISHLAPLLEGEVWIGAYIGNWVGNAHKLSLKLKYHPGGERNADKAVVVPLFNTLNLMEQAGQSYPGFLGHDSLRVTVKLDHPIKDAQMVYLTTGHGGWGGGDEFNPKVNTIFMDGQKVFTFIPWREDCSTYRNSNPASGNFSNGLSSSDLSRSNWCPGTVTNPVYVPLGDLAAGEHTFTVTIPQGEPDGGSFSYWCLSAEIIGQK